MEFRLPDFLSTISQYNGSTMSEQFLLKDLEMLHDYSFKAKHVKLLQNDEVDFTEVLSFLVNIICERKCPDVIHKAVQILSNLSDYEEVRTLLHVTYNLSSPLAALITTPTTDDAEYEAVAARLRLLQRITYGHQIDYHQPHIDQLVLFLVQQVLCLRKNPDMASPVLGSLTNLCRNNPVIQTAVKTTIPDQVKQIMKIICFYMEDKDKTLVSYALGLYVAICTSEPKGEEARLFFEEGTFELVLQSLFNILQNNFKSPAWRHASDLLIDLLARWKESISSYRHLQQCLKNILSLLNLASKEQASEVFRLFIRLSSVAPICHLIGRLLLSPLAEGLIGKTDVARAASHAPKPDSPALLSCVHWSAQIGQSATLSSSTQQNKQFASQSMAPSGGNVTSLAQEFLSLVLADDKKLSECAMHLLMPGTSALLCKAGDETDSLVKLLIVLCDNPKSLQCLDKGLTCTVLCNHIDRYLTGGGHHSLVTEAGGDKRDKDLSVLLLLNLAAKIEAQVSGLPEYLMTTLKAVRVQEMLGRGLTSGSQLHVSMSLNLLMRTPDLPTMQLCNLIASLNQKKNKRNGHDSDSSAPRHNNRSPKLLQDISNQIENVSLIEKMDSLEPTNPKNETMQVLRHHISKQNAKEEQLQRLVESKTQVLHQANSTITQLRSSIASSSAEMKKLLRALHEEENRGEQMKMKLSQSEKDREGQLLQLEELSKYKEMFSNEAKDLEKKLKGKTNEYDNLSKERDILEEKYIELEEKLSQEKKTSSNRIAELQVLKTAQEEKDKLLLKLKEEKRVLTKELKETAATLANKEEILQNMTTELHNCETNLKKYEEKSTELSKEKDDLEKYLDRLQSTLEEKEASNKNLNAKVKVLDRVVADKERDLTATKAKVVELEAKVAHLEEEYDKFQSILSFINSKKST